jgi:hypothetical protein
MDFAKRCEEMRSEFNCEDLAQRHKGIVAQRDGEGRGAGTGERITARGAI